MEKGRPFEDVIFGAILGVWSTKVPGLWAEEAGWQKPISFLLMAALLALVLKATWEVSDPFFRFVGVLWMSAWIFIVSYGGVQSGVFSKKEATVFGLVFGFWFLTALISEMILRLYRR